MPLVLVADDDPLIRGLLRKLLQSLDYRMIEVTTGPAAIEAAIEHSPAIILLDYQMPEMTGQEVARTLHQQFPKAKWAVLLMSGHPPRLTPTELSDCGIDGFMPKPFTQAILKEVLADGMALAIKRGRHASHPPPGFGDD